MPSSTSNSENSEMDFPVFERAVPILRWSVAGAVAVVVLALSMGAWEMHWRAFGAEPTYRNSEGLWAIQRKRIDQGEGEATVLVGSSRTLSDINLNVWEKLDGHRPIQLALEGTTPLPVMEGLADDPNFKGRLIVGVAPLLFFSGFQFRTDVLEYYPKETPSQRFGQWLSMTFLEPYAAYYDPDFALIAVLKRQGWPQRAGVRRKDDVRRLFTSSADRNMHMWQKMEIDTTFQTLQQSIWKEFWDPPDPKMMAAGPKLRAEQLDRFEKVVKKLRERGVQVIFVLHPIDGEFRGVEMMVNPRAETWDVLLSRTGVPGIHFLDYPQLQGYRLPEWSHMASADAERYTEALYPIVKAKLGEDR